MLVLARWPAHIAPRRMLMPSQLPPVLAPTPRARMSKRSAADHGYQVVVGLRRGHQAAVGVMSVGANCRDSFSTLEQAKKNLCYFDGTETIEEVIQ